MNASDVSFSTSILIPVMFVIVLELASIARGISLRDNIPDSENAPYRPRGDLFLEKYIRLIPGFRHDEKILNYGHFGQLHGAFLVILLYGAALVGYTTDGITRYVLGFSIAVVIGLQPYLEIPEYSDIQKMGVKITSPRVHFVSAIWGSAIFSKLGEAYANGSFIGYVVLVGIILGLIPIAILEAKFSQSLLIELKKWMDSESSSEVA